MGLIVNILMGALVGWIASVVTKRDERQGWLGNILVGIGGALIGTALSVFLTGADRAHLEFDLTSTLWSIGGAVLLCLGLNALENRKTL